ncbi:MAG TPA: hypothetical protein VJV21_00205 [Pyrinomonadaceae bacterium]|nr:hypothetical protein [Pyrinomonadaceae bacterium]
MFKQISVTRVALSAFIFTMFCLPSVATAQTPGEPQQGINTTRSNIKNTSRTAGTRFDPLVLNLKKASGESVLTSQIADLNKDGKLSEAESAFDLGMLTAGEYELSFSDADGQSSATAIRGITINTTHVEYSDAKTKAAGNADPNKNSDVGRVTVTLTGVVGGTLKQELQAQITTSAGELSRPGKTKFKNIVLFKADGRSQVKGTLKHDASMPAIKNTR